MTIFPNNQAFINNGPSAVPAGLFSENAKGRITPIGNFSGFEDSVWMSTIRDISESSLTD